VTVLTTAELATVLGIAPGSVARWARRRGVTGVQLRDGRSTVTVWRYAEVERACVSSVSACA
jgi:hypothetical protein